VEFLRAVCGEAEYDFPPPPEFFGEVDGKAEEGCWDQEDTIEEMKVPEMFRREERLFGMFLEIFVSWKWNRVS